MRDIATKFRNASKIVVYAVFILAIFSLSLFVMPFEFFFVSAVFVLIALRGVEKELEKFGHKPTQLFGRKM